ncbi:MAG: ribonuclease HI [Gemmatimonadetes bacterium]|nr:ribonuclease HI [Gemmatimonadota bacterium]
MKYLAAEARIATPILHIHVDESCLGNQFQARANPGGAAGLVEFWNGDEWVRRDFWLSEPDTTNNRMAIRSGIEGLTLLTQRYRVEVVSDSQYLVKGMNEWLPGWKAKGWKRKGGPIQNLELWQQLERVAASQDVQWSWVRGHAGLPKNEYVNDLAVEAARELTQSGGLVPSGFRAWLEEQREKKGQYLDYFEFEAPA